VALETHKPAKTIQNMPSLDLEYSMEIEPARKSSSKIITGRTGGDKGGMPVKRKETTGVSRATISEKVRGKKKGASAIGQNMGKNTGPSSNP